jgi:choline kinase
MNAVILAGLGTCLSEEIKTRRKPLVEIAATCRIMKYYAAISSRPPFDC